MATLTAFPPLPTELVREIVELSAKDHPCVALALLRVSAFMQQWIEPLVYETVILSTAKQVEQFGQTLSVRPHVGRYVRRLSVAVAYRGYFIAIRPIFLSCPNVLDLRTHVLVTQEPCFYPTAITLSRHGVPASFAGQIFGKVTHLRLFHALLPGQAYQLRTMLPQLTHLSMVWATCIIGETAMLELVETLLERECIEVVDITVVVASPDNTVATFDGIKDRRLLVRQLTDVDWPADHWELAVKEGRCVWEEAVAAMRLQSTRS